MESDYGSDANHCTIWMSYKAPFGRNVDSAKGHSTMN